MPGLLYYLPDRRGVTPEQLKELGLGHAFDPSSAIAKRGVSKGPDDGPGVVVADVARVPAHLVGFHPAKQAWRKIPGSRTDSGEGSEKQLWVGRYTDSPVLPSDLALNKQLDAYEVTLGDEQPWLIPVARGRLAKEDSLRWYPALPEAADIDEAGEWISRGVVPKYADLWKLAEDYWDLRWPGSAEDADEDEKENKPPAAGRVRITFDFAGSADAAVAALAVNYHVAKAEVALLGLLTDECIREILDALIDWPVVEEWMKKKLSASTPEPSPTGDGPAAETPATDRP